MSVEFDTPANRIIAQQQPKNKFTINTNLPDLSFLRQLSVQGRLVFFQSNVITNTTPLQIIPKNGETFFYYRGVFTTGSTTTLATCSILNDGQQREQFLIPPTADGIQSTFPYVSQFVDSLVGDGLKIFEVTNSVSTNVKGSLFGWIENTSRIRDVTT